MTNLEMTRMACIICNKLGLTPEFGDPSISAHLNNDGMTGAESLARFFCSLGRYLGDNEKDNHTVPKGFEKITTNITATFCSECSKIAESFCQLFHQLEYIKLQLNRKVRTLSNLLSASQKDNQSQIKRNWTDAYILKTERFSLDEIVELITDFRGDLIKKCMRKLETSVPRLELRKFQPTPAITNLSNTVTTYVLPCEIKSESGLIATATSPEISPSSPCFEPEEMNSDWIKDADYDYKTEPFISSELLDTQEKDISNAVKTETRTHSSYIKTENPNYLDDAFNDSWGLMETKANDSRQNSSSSSQSESEGTGHQQSPFIKVPPPVTLSSSGKKFGKSRFQCSQCPKIFTYRSACFRHYRDVHLKVKSFKCPSCDHNFTRKENLATHLENPSNCTKRTGQHVRKKIKRKVHSQNDAEVEATTEELPQPSTNSILEKVEEPKQSSAGSSLPKKVEKGQKVPEAHLCSECGKVFPRRDLLSSHMKIVHLKSARRTCDQCGNEFSCSANLRAHVKQVHLKLRKLVCEQCGKTFARASQLKQHVNIMHLKLRVHECDVCGRMFKMKRTMLDHRRMVHADK